MISARPSRVRPWHPACLALFAGWSLILTCVHANLVNLAEAPRFDRGREQRHAEIVEGTGAAPFVYRVLVPELVEHTRGLARVLGATPGRMERELTYLFWRFLFTLGLFLVFHAWLLEFFDPAWALCGGALLFGLHPPSYFHYWYQPASALDILLWTLAAWSSLRRSLVWLVPLVELGALNRETIVFAIPLALLVRWGRAKPARLLLEGALLSAVWAAVFFGLRQAIGARPRVIEMREVIAENLAHPAWFLYAFAFFGALWLLPLGRWRAVPAELRRAALVLVPYLALQLVFGRVREVRLLLPAALVLIPASLAVLRAVAGGGAAAGAGRGEGARGTD